MHSPNIATGTERLRPTESGRHRLDRSPHPYQCQSVDLPDRIYKTIPAPYVLHDDDALILKDEASSTCLLSEGDGQRRLMTPPSDSGTEADDERPLLRALTAPPLRPRKGLRNAKYSPSASPSLTPSILEDEPTSYNFDLGPIKRKRIPGTVPDKQKAKLQKRRGHIVFRRLLETLLLGAIGCLCLAAAKVNYTREISLYVATIVVIYAFTIGRLLVRLVWKSSDKSIVSGIRIPISKDPAPLLYPLVVPTYVALLVAAERPMIILANLILGISAIPGQAVPTRTGSIHWALTIIPLLFFRKSYEVESSRSVIGKQFGIELEMLSILYPLHQALSLSLEFLTTTSLLNTEVQLLSIGLTNLLLFSESPQAFTNKALLWIGGLTLFVTCKDVLRFAVSLARVPGWRFKQVKHGIFKRNPILRTIDGVLGGWLSSKLENSMRQDNADSEDELLEQPRPRSRSQQRDSMDVAISESSQRRASDYSSIVNKSRQRRNTLPAATLSPSDLPQLRRTASIGFQKLRSNRPKTFQALTSAQAFVLKWLYAGYTYSVIVLTIVIPVRVYIGRYALNGHEPFGWALGYLFGAIRSFRLHVVSWHLDRWIPLPEYGSPTSKLPEPAMMRLYIAAHIFLTLGLGLVLVLRLAPLAEVDTRRKLFHGMMVTMFLPTIPIDPCFVALALSLALAVFLLLDLFRASQLPPLSRPLTLFLAPYVDGRDHRGPVVVSHIFLLIGCAVPLWLELAASSRIGTGAMDGWAIPTKSIGLISGVVCVGMGDAAASLVGRRFGRRRWPWGGGKSLEGSAAFAVAVVIGLMGAKLWILALAGWEGRSEQANLLATLCKTFVAACGASFTEAVLTGANDNVLVPVMLWLLVRGLDI
jgi:dolichol kinase